MKRTTLLAFTLLSATSCFAASDISTYIVNGEDVDVADYPSTVAFFLDTIEYDGYYYAGSFCGGTYLDSTHVLTAAHCFYDDEQARLFTVAVPYLQNESDYPYDVQRIRISEIYYPDDYASDASQLYPNDIAIVTLEEAMSSGSAITRADSEDYRSTEESFFAVGHGNTATGVDNADSLQAASLTYVANATCQKAFSDGEALTSKQICFTGDYSEASGLKNAVCNGDSGGPVYWQDTDTDTLTQVGVTSFGPSICGNASSTVTSVFTELTDYSDWIDEVLDGQIEPTLTSTEDERESYFSESSVTGGGSDSSTDESTLASLSSSGGSLGSLWLLILMPLAMLRRRQR